MYSQEVADRVCELIASGKSLRQIAELDGMPAPSTVNDWRKNRFGDSAEFSAQYTRAKQDQADALAEETLGIADDLEIPADHKRVMVDTRKWYAAKLAPKVWGDKQLIEHSGEVTQTNLTYEDAKRIAQERSTQNQ